MEALYNQQGSTCACVVPMLWKTIVFMTYENTKHEKSSSAQKRAFSTWAIDNRAYSARSQNDLDLETMPLQRGHT
jgi:hypothetical protein